MNALSRALLACVALSLVAGGCGDDGHDHDHMDHEMCTGDEQAFAVGAVASGDAYTLELISAEPNPPIVGDNTFVVELTDGSGAPVEGAAVTAESWQHVHDHGTPVVATVSDLGGGQYEAGPLNVIHKGSWEFRFAIDSGKTSDFAFFHFCVEP